MTAWFKKAGRVLGEAAVAGGTAVGAAYSTNPGMSGEQMASVAASAAILYVIGRALPQANILKK